MISEAEILEEIDKIKPYAKSKDEFPSKRDFQISLHTLEWVLNKNNKNGNRINRPSRR